MMESADSAEEFVSENRHLMARILAHGDAEARGHALALIANRATVSDIDEIQQQLEQLRQEKEGEDE